MQLDEMTLHEKYTILELLLTKYEYNKNRKDLKELIKIFRENIDNHKLASASRKYKD